MYTREKKSYNVLTCFHQKKKEEEEEESAHQDASSSCVTFCASESSFADPLVCPKLAFAAAVFLFGVTTAGGARPLDRA